MADRIAIVEGARTPFAKAGTALRDVPAHHLARRAIEAVLDRTAFPPARLSEIVVGCVAQPVEAMNVARVAALLAGVPEAVPARTVHRNCASGFEAITSAAEKIRAGAAEASVAAGAESMSNIPLLFSAPFARWFEGVARARTPWGMLRALARWRPSMLRPRIGVVEGLTDYATDLSMGEAAEALAREFGVPREEQDAFALASHRRAWSARDLLREEIAPVLPPPDFAEMVRDDVGPRRDVSIEGLRRLAPRFDPAHGTVTSGNACPLTDGAAAVLLMPEAAARAAGIEPLGYLRSYAYVGLAPARMGLGPAFAIPAALDRAGAALADVGVVEMNEAFAAQILACLRATASRSFAERELGRSAPVGEIRPEILNPNGGAIALGHPVGATGVRLVISCLREMRRRDAGLGIASLCVGGGQGAALVLER